MKLLGWERGVAGHDLASHAVVLLSNGRRRIACGNRRALVDMSDENLVPAEQVLRPRLCKICSSAIGDLK